MNLVSTHINRWKILTKGEIVRGETTGLKNVESTLKLFSGAKDPNSIQTCRTKILPNGNKKRQFIGYNPDGSISLQTKLFGPDYKVKYHNAGTRNYHGDTISFSTKKSKDGVLDADSNWAEAITTIKAMGLNII